MAIGLVHANLPVSANGANLSFTITATTGNLIVVVIVALGVTVTACTDSKGNSYTVSATHGTATSGNTYAAYSFSTTSGVTSITLTNASGGVEVAVYDLSSSTGGAIDTVSALSSQTTGNPAPSLTAAGAGFVAAVISANSGPSGVAAPFTFDSFDQVQLNHGGAAHDVNASGGLLTATFTDAGSTVWSSAMISVKESAGAAFMPDEDFWKSPSPQFSDPDITVWQ